MTRYSLLGRSGSKAKTIYSMVRGNTPRYGNCFGRAPILPLSNHPIEARGGVALFNIDNEVRNKTHGYPESVGFSTLL